MGLDTDPDDIADRMIAFIREAGIPIAMVGILGVLRDTPDYKRFKRAGRLVENARYGGDSGIFSRQLSFVPNIPVDELLDRHRRTVETLNSPEIYFERCLTSFHHMRMRPVSRMPLGMTEVKAFLRSLWHQGVTGTYRKVYWRFLASVLAHHREVFPDAIRLAVQGHHLIQSTQQALQVDEIKTFLTEALENLEKYCEGYREAFQRNVGGYASKLMQTVHDHFEHFQDDHRTLQHNAEVLVCAAQDYYDAARSEIRHQIREPLERFYAEIDRLVENYVPDDGAVPQA